MLDVYTETQQIANGRKIIGEMEKVISEYPESTFNSFYYYSASKFYNSVEYEASALQSIEKGLAFAAKLNQNYDYLTLSFEKYRILKANKRFGEAKSVILPLLNDKKYSGKKKNRLMFLKEISEIEENLGNYKQANLYLKDFVLLNDSLQKENEKMEIMNLEKKFNTAQKEKEIQLLENKSQQQKTTFWTVLAGVSLAGFFLVNYFIQRK